MPVNYQLGKIYKIECYVTGLIYIGSTCEPILARRLAGHVSNYKCYLNGNTNYVTSFKVLEYFNYDIILIEDYPCNSKDQLHARERFWTLQLDCVNKNKNQGLIAELGGTSEYKKNYRQENLELMHQKDKLYRENNKEKINRKNKCVCGVSYRHIDKSRHERSKKHQDFITEIEKPIKTLYESNTICRHCVYNKLDDEIIKEIQKKHFFSSGCGDCMNQYRINSLI
jgi:hypothetical protein